MVGTRAINPPELGRPIGYANGMLAPPVLYVAGQIGARPDAKGDLKVVSRRFAAQFEVALENVLAVVRAAGGEPSSIVDMTVYVKDMGAYRRGRKEIGAAWRRLLGRHFPAMTLIGVRELFERGALVEINARARVGP